MTNWENLRLHLSVLFTIFAFIVSFPVSAKETRPEKDKDRLLQVPEQEQTAKPSPNTKETAKKINIGIDIFVPFGYLEFRTEYLDLVQSYESVIMTVRGDIPVDLGKGWKYSGRVDVPFGWSNLVSNTNPIPTKEKFGFSDVSLQNLFIAPDINEWTYGFGFQVMFPTATTDELGTGRYQLVPMAGFRYDLGGWLQGAWCDFIIKQYKTVGGDENRKTINHTAMLPRLNIFLPRKWFILFAPEFRYRWETRKWFLPFDIMAGKKITDSLVLSVEYKAAIIGIFPLYDQAVEGRIGFLF